MSLTPPLPVFPAEAEAGSPRGSWRRIRQPAAIVALALTLNLAGNGRVSLWDRDEPRYAGCVREMRGRGDWIYPTFNAEPRFHKPILIYWLMRAGFALGGDNPYGARLVSAVSGSATCLVVWLLGRRMLGPQAGLLAALFLATSPIMVSESKLATTDATLALWLVSAQACLWELGQRESRRLAGAFWVLMALATLTKGPVGPALIAAAGVVSWWWGGPSPCWKRLRPRWGIPLFLLVAAPWFVVVGILSQGDFFRFAVGQQIVARVSTGMEKHAGFPGYYLLTTLGTFHPWSALLPAALYGAWLRRRTHPAFAFLLGWAIGPLLLLECVRTKLVHYYLPAIPACALLAAWLIVAVVAAGANLRRWPLGRLGVALMGGTAAALLAAFTTGAALLPAAMRAPLLALAAVLTAGTTYGLVRLRAGATLRAVQGLALTWALIMLGVGGWLLPAAEPYRTSRIVGEKLAQLAEARNVQPALHSFQEPSVIYAYGRPVPTIRRWAQLRALVQRHGTVVTALLPHELREFRKKSYLDIELCERLTGFNLNNGTNETLQFILIRPAPSALAAGGKETLIK